jgi:hypothetical protein
MIYHKKTPIYKLVIRNLLFFFIIYLEFNVILPITTQEEFEDTKS